MSSHLFTPAYGTRFGNLTAKSVLVKLCEEANNDGLGWPSVATIVRDTEVERRTVLRIIQTFVAIDLVELKETEISDRFGRRTVQAIQVNTALLGRDLTEAFAKAYADAQGKVAVLNPAGKWCLRDAEKSVSETRESVSETRGCVSETFPPDPLLGRPVIDPLPDPPTSAAVQVDGFTPEQQEHLDRLAAKCGSGDGRKDHYAEQDLREWTARYADDNRKAQEHAAAAEADAVKDRELQAKYPDVETAIRRVRLECGFAWADGDELGPVMRRVFADQLEMGKPVWRVAAQMEAAWMLQRRQGPKLRARYGPLKFIRDGHWLDPAGWHWNTELLSREISAGTGSVR